MSYGSGFVVIMDGTGEREVALRHDIIMLVRALHPNEMLTQVYPKAITVVEYKGGLGTYPEIASTDSQGDILARIARAKRGEREQ